jgi:hypothetical protein
MALRFTKYSDKLPSARLTSGDEIGFPKLFTLKEIGENQGNNLESLALRAARSIRLS